MIERPRPILSKINLPNNSLMEDTNQQQKSKRIDIEPQKNDSHFYKKSVRVSWRGHRVGEVRHKF